MQVEEHDVDPERRRCPACGDEYRAHGSEDSEQLEIEVRAYRRVIKRRRYRRSCQCAAAPALVTVPAPSRLIPKGILGISIWVTVLIDKYLLYRPTYRLLADLRAHGLDLAQGTVTGGLRRLAPLFAPLREALIARSRMGEPWHADETSWQVFEADYCGRLFSEQEMQLIRAIIAEDPSRHRFALSKVVCERLHWRRANGQLKDMSCRVAMLRMHRDGLIPLPAPRRCHYNGTLHRLRTPQAEPELPIIARVDALPALQVRPLADQREAQLWREYVDRYHYLGYTPLPGAQQRYLVTSQRQVLAVVGFGASAWKAAPRDRFIGWSVAQREARLQLVVNNARFLILPWVQVRNLASTVLSRSSRRLPDDWQDRYGYRPLLLETFRAVRPLHRHQLPRRQLDPRRTDPRSRQTRCA